MRRISNLRSFFSLLLVVAGAPATAGASELETTKSLLDLYREGGPVMHVIALCSVATLALASYCAIMFRKAKMMPARYSTGLSSTS